MPQLTIPSLVGGVSRQPPAIRLPNQLEEADNVLLDLERGAARRPGTEHIAAGDTTDGSLDVTSVSTTDFFVHWINRDENNRFVVLIGEEPLNEIQAFNLKTGSKQGYTISNGANQYIYEGSSSVTDKLKAITVADTTFIVNTEVTTALTGTATTYQDTAATGPVRNAGNPNNQADFGDFPQPPASTGDNFYAQDDYPGRPAGFYTSISTAQQPWYQRLKTEGANSELDPDTMPVQLSTGWKLNTITWTPRYSGDSETNPGPSFIDKELSDVSFHRNRLIFAAQEQIVTSGAGDFFNFWNDSYQTITDADPVDVSLSESSIHTVQHLAGFNQSLVILSDNSRQFELRANDVLAPSTATIIPTTRYATDPNVRPVSMGNQLYIPSSKGGDTAVLEYFLSYDGATNVAIDVTQHAAGYVKGTITKMSASSTHDIIFATTSDATNVIYVYQSNWQIDQKVQSAWSKWIFDESYEIISHEVIEDYLYLLIRRGSKYWLERLFITEPVPDSDGVNTMTYPIYLDSKQAMSGSYNSATNETTWDLDHLDTTINYVVTGAGFGNQQGNFVPVTNTTVGSITRLAATRDYSAHKCWVGRTYKSRLRISEPVAKQEGGTPVEGTVSVLKATVFYKDSGNFDVEITPTGSSTRTYTFSARRHGGLSAMIGQPLALDNGEFLCTPFYHGGEGEFDITSETHMPFVITNINLDIRFSNRRNFTH